MSDAPVNDTSFHQPSFHEPAVRVRPATPEDFPAIARLLMQLYAAELPGALSGPSEGQQHLLEFTLGAKQAQDTQQAQGTQGRYVACDATGSILGTGTIEYPRGPRYERAPDGTIRLALSLLGPRATMRLLLTVAQSMVGAARPNAPDGAWLHSVVVDEEHRGQGIGRTLMSVLERQASEHGCQTAWLQVLLRNRAACLMYRQLGYTEVSSTAPWQRVLTWPSSLLSKSLSPCPQTEQ